MSPTGLLPPRPPRGAMRGAWFITPGWGLSLGGRDAVVPDLARCAATHLSLQKTSPPFAPRVGAQWAGGLTAPPESVTPTLRIGVGCPNGASKKTKGERRRQRPSAHPARWASPLFFNLPILPLKWWVATVLPRALRFKRPLHRCNACNPKSLKWSQSPVLPRTGCAYETRLGTGPTAKVSGSVGQ
jgi:hypothetical protein